MNYSPRALAGSTAQRAVQARSEFIMRTYGHLLGAVLAFAACEVFLFTSGLYRPIIGVLMGSGMGWLLVLGGFDKGELIEGHLTVEDKDNNQWYGFWGQPPVYAHGTRALLDGQSDLAVIDASNPAEPKIVKRVPRIGYLSYVEVHENDALLTLGQQGVQWLDLQ